MKNRKFVVVDTETGGLDPDKTSLLEISGFLVDFQASSTIKLFSFFVKEPEIVVEPEAMAVNNINLEEVREFGLSPSEAIERIEASVWPYLTEPDEKVFFVGHNVYFDYAFMKRLYSLAGKDIKEGCFERRALDTSAIYAWMMLMGFLPDQRQPSSSNLFDACNIDVPEGMRHRAEGDAYATAKSILLLYNKFRNKTQIQTENTTY